jgi:hypothetical protein
MKWAQRAVYVQHIPNKEESRVETRIYRVDSVTISVIKTNPPRLHIYVQGTAATSGWSSPRLRPFVYVQPPPDGIWDFDFVAEPPTGITLPVLTPIQAQINWPDAKINGVRIHAVSNYVEKMRSGAKEFPPIESKGEGEPFPFSDAHDGDSPFPLHKVVGA